MIHFWINLVHALLLCIVPIYYMCLIFSEFLMKLFVLANKTAYGIRKINNTQYVLISQGIKAFMLTEIDEKFNFDYF